MSKEMKNILEEYDKLNAHEAVSKSVDEDEKNTVEATEEQVAETTEEPAKEPEKVTEEDAKEAQEQGEKVESEEVPEEDVEKSTKESKDPVDKKDTKTEDKDNEKRKNKKDKDSDEDEEDDSKDKKEDKKEKTSKSISDEDILVGFKTILKSFENLNEEKKEFATKSEVEGLSKSIKELSAKLDTQDTEDVSKSVDNAEDGAVEKSVTSTNGEQEKVEGYVSKSVDTEEQAETGEAKSEEAEAVQEDNTFKGLSQEERATFMDAYKTQAKDPRASKHDLQSAYQSYLNVNTDPTNASEKDIKTVKDFAQI